MLQSALADRFRLRGHLERRDFPTRVLTVSKAGLKIRESRPVTQEAPIPPISSPDDARFPPLPPGLPAFKAAMSIAGGSIVYRMRAQRQSMAALAKMIRDPNSDPVLDRTGLTGLYDFTLEYAIPQPGAAEDSDLPPLGIALQRQLGIQLSESKVSFDVLIIDSFDRFPTEN
jgi:uncharacterized protein (TIGR03435 family)